MYTQGFGAAVLVGLVALVLPGLWFAWWLVAALGERVSGNEVGRRPRTV
jgi:hypothetical protein